MQLASSWIGVAHKCTLYCTTNIITVMLMILTDVLCGSPLICNCKSGCPSKKRTTANVSVPGLFVVEPTLLQMQILTAKSWGNCHLEFRDWGARASLAWDGNASILILLFIRLFLWGLVGCSNIFERLAICLYLWLALNLRVNVPSDLPKISLNSYSILASQTNIHCERTTKAALVRVCWGVVI